jgi:hypothetical protein
MEDINRKLTNSLIEMCENNTGAYLCLMKLMDSNRRIDPTNAFGPMGTIIVLHSSKLKGNSIHLLYNEICQQNIARTIAVIRAVQLGIICKSLVIAATSDWSTARAHSLDLKTLYRRVKQYLAFDFDPNNEAAFD